MKNYTRIISQKTFEKKVKDYQNIEDAYTYSNKGFMRIEFKDGYISLKKVYLNTSIYYVMSIFTRKG